MPPEYYEYVRLRDVYLRDVAAINAMIDTLTAQRRLLNGVTSREATANAALALDKAIGHLSELQVRLTTEIEEVARQLARVREEVQA